MQQQNQLLNRGVQQNWILVGSGSKTTWEYHVSEIASYLSFPRAVSLEATLGQHVARVETPSNHLFTRLTRVTRSRDLLPSIRPQAMVQGFGLNSICRYLTTRETLLVDHQFSIMLDSTDFDHSVGEIELQTGSRNRARRHRQVHAEYSWFLQTRPTRRGK